MSIFATKLIAVATALKLVAIDRSSILAASTYATLLNAVAIIGKFLEILGVSDTQVVLDQMRVLFRKAISNSISALDTTISNVGKLLSDTQGTTDSKAIKLRRSTSDSVGTSDSYSRQVKPKYVDTVTTPETRTVRYSKVNADTQAVVDVIYKGTRRSLADTTGASDNFSSIRRYIRAYVDTVIATDDFYGVANVDDDQSAKFTKILSDLQGSSDAYIRRYAKPLSDTFSAADLYAKKSTKTFGDTTTTAESGNLFINSYISTTYFASSYVGTTKTF